MYICTHMYVCVYLYIYVYMYDICIHTLHLVGVYLVSELERIRLGHAHGEHVAEDGLTLSMHLSIYRSIHIYIHMCVVIYTYRVNPMYIKHIHTRRTWLAFALYPNLSEYGLATNI